MSIIDLGLGLTELGINARVELGLYPECCRIHFPELSRSMQGIGEQYHNGVTYSEIALPAVLRAPAEVWTFGGWSYYEGMSEYFETGDPRAMQEASGRMLVFTTLVAMTPTNGIMTPPDLMPLPPSIILPKTPICLVVCQRRDY